MKTIINVTVAAILLLATSQLFAQREKEIQNNEVQGIYLNAATFRSGKLTRPTDKIRLKQFFISPEIITIEQGKKTVFYKDSIFAIQLTNGENYRFIKRTPYLIADTSSLYIYTRKTVKATNRQAGSHNISVAVPVTYYYFSYGNHKTIYSLTLANLRKYVLTDATIHLAVCNKFTTDEMLQKINEKTGHFELNETILSKLNK
jgi:VIT1/CCC1 family predicted Fe2+/Mn2+ transporter